jgi:hypothetical protein
MPTTTMTAASDTWFCARFAGTPDLKMLSNYHSRLGVRVPMFFAREGAEGQVVVYLPPEAAAAVVLLNAEGKLVPFAACDAPPGNRVNVLFGGDADLKRHFPSLHSERAHGPTTGGR